MRLNLIDTYRHKGLRQNLVAFLSTKGIYDEDVLLAINNVPRHFFLDNAFADLAYQDRALQIGAGQTISQPYTVAFQTQLLNIKKGEKVLEIGTGSGYQTSVLCELDAQVISIERQEELFLRTKEFLPKLNYKARLIYGDGYKGYPALAPYDKILITCGAPSVPHELLKQLKVGGKMVIPIGAGDVQTMTEFIRESETEIKQIEHGKFRFVPMLEDKSKK